jgi:RNA polymerase sigma-70 factor (ECF subfamily)
MSSSMIAPTDSGVAQVRRPAAGRTLEQELLDHLPVLLRTALRLTRHYQDAEDLVQDTCLCAFGSIHQFTPGTNLRVWLLRIMVNLNRDACRSQVGAPRAVSLTAERSAGRPDLAETLPSRFAPVEELVLAAAQSEWLRSELAALPAQFAKAVCLADLEDRSYDEIAAATGFARNTVGTRLFRGQALLRERLLRASHGADPLARSAREDEPRCPARARGADLTHQVRYGH